MLSGSVADEVAVEIPLLSLGEDDEPMVELDEEGQQQLDEDDGLDHDFTTAGIELRDVWRSYGATPVLRGLSMSVRRGTSYGLLGPSGCGKTSLLKVLLGRLIPDDGTVLVLGQAPNTPGHPIPGRAVGYTPQELALYEDCSVSENFRFYGTMACMSPEDVVARSEWLLGFLELGHMSNRIVSSLSGGQKRRVSLAVSLLHSPELLILDEPTVGVDPLLRNRIWKYLRKLNELGTTIIITTHYIEEAAQADCVGLMRGGKLLEEGAPVDLIAKYSVHSLEDVFLHLCKISEAEAEAAAAESGTSAGTLTTSGDSESAEYTSISMPDLGDALPAATGSPSISASSSASSYTTTAPLAIGGGGAAAVDRLLGVPESPTRVGSPVPRSPARSPSPGLLRIPSPGLLRSPSPGLLRSPSPGPRCVSPRPLRSPSPGPRLRKPGASVQDEYEFTEHVQATAVYEREWHRKSAQHIAAICRRKITQMVRNPRAFIFEFFLPVAQMCLFLVAIGNDPTGLPVVVVNHDVGFDIGLGHLQHSVNLGQQYTDHLKALDDHVLSVTEMDILDAAVQLVKDGDAWTVVYIPESFTSNLMTSLAGDAIDTSDSQVVLYMDLSNYQVSLIIDKELAFALDATIKDATNITTNPVRMEAVYGSMDIKFSDFLAPGIIILIVFAFSIGMTAIAFVREKIDGCLDRIWASGVAPINLIIAYFLTHSAILMLQSMLSMVVVEGLFHVPIAGNIFITLLLMYLLMLMLGWSGMSMGLVISSFAKDEMDATRLALAAFFPSLLVSGVLWPLEGIPIYIKPLSLMLPTTWAADAMRSIMIRGWYLNHWVVLRSFLVTGGWAILCVFLASGSLSGADSQAPRWWQFWRKAKPSQKTQ